jgi:ABC-type bacteriocin/lantibiotic exporter with double-glycine peptidase domain
MTEILRIVRLLRPYWRYIAQSLMVALLLLLLQIPGPYFTKLLIDDAYPNRDLSLMSFALILGAGISIGVGGISFMSGCFGQCVGTSIGLRFQSLF